MPGPRLCLCEREEIRSGVDRELSIREIARRLGRSASTISREISRNRSQRGYVAHVAHRRAGGRARRPKPLKLNTDLVLRDRVTELLDDKLSPRSVARLLLREGLHVSHETIYRAAYHPSDPLGPDRYRQLTRPRRGRIRRARTRSRRAPQPLGDYQSVHDRVLDGPGHWEGDLLVGANNRSVAAVLTERSTRIVRLVALPQGRRTDHVCAQITQALADVPDTLIKSITWDQGRELTAWPTLQHDLATPVYFCDPASPWQKPLVENTCGLLRRWLPRNQPIPTDQTTLDRYAHLLNNMPRRILGYRSATDAYDELVATTT